MARFETVAHRWVHVGEHGFGVAVANDATYGHDITSAPREDGEAGGTVRTCGCRCCARRSTPDPEADQGEHTFRVSIRPADVVREGYRL